MADRIKTALQDPAAALQRAKIRCASESSSIFPEGNGRRRPSGIPRRVSGGEIRSGGSSLII